MDEVKCWIASNLVDKMLAVKHFCKVGFCIYLFHLKSMKDMVSLIVSKKNKGAG